MWLLSCYLRWHGHGLGTNLALDKYCDQADRSDRARLINAGDWKLEKDVAFQIGAVHAFSGHPCADRWIMAIFPKEPNCSRSKPLQQANRDWTYSLVGVTLQKAAASIVQWRAT
jgi:hypothetical protein